VLYVCGKLRFFHLLFLRDFLHGCCLNLDVRIVSQLYVRVLVCQACIPSLRCLSASSDRVCDLFDPCLYVVGAAIFLVGFVVRISHMGSAFKALRSVLGA
jgi:hypothetical protein